jgi:putative CocE/NonD family hydrolase
MMKNLFCVVFLCMNELLATAQHQPWVPAKGLSFETGIPMTDGTVLSTQVYLPDTGKKCAAVLIRTPYNKELEMWFDKRFLSYGIAIVMQDVRGKFKSQGVFYPFANERSDGLQTLRWIRSQPWSNGIVGGWGVSYMGYTQWVIADSLDVLAPLLAGSNVYDFIYPDGMFSLQSAFLWGYANATHPGDLSPDKVRSRLSRLPLSVADDSISFLSDWLRHEKEDGFWKSMSFQERIKAPVISIAGWYDIFLKAQLQDFQTLSANGNPGNRLIIGPWCHGLQGYKRDYGGETKTGSYGQLMFQYTVNALCRKKDTLPPFLKDTRFNLFIMERNEYVGSDSWPPRETKTVPYFLRPDKSLSDRMPDRSAQFTYTYDPSDPYPNYGGTFLGDSVGPALQNRNLGRQDQLGFETAVLEKPLTLLGPVTATLWLSSDVSCTDFMVCIQDVFPDGRIINIQEGGAHVRFTTKGPEEKQISVWATGYQLNPGHRLRAVVTSSWFPRFNRTLNGCDPIYDAVHIRKANQHLYVGIGMPSVIDLPVYEPGHK